MANCIEDATPKGKRDFVFLGTAFLCLDAALLRILGLVWDREQVNPLALALDCIHDPQKLVTVACFWIIGGIGLLLGGYFSVWVPRWFGNINFATLSENQAFVMTEYTVLVYLSSVIAVSIGMLCMMNCLAG